LRKTLITCVFIILQSNSIQSQVQDQSFIRQPQKGSIITGACLIAVPTLIAIIGSSREGYGYERIIPVSGPLIYAGLEQASTPEIFGHIGLSLAETIGMVLVIRGFIGKKIPVSVSPQFLRNGFGCRVSFAITRQT
jgi:hypothetical protein